jgi:hypothetical protein
MLDPHRLWQEHAITMAWLLAMAVVLVATAVVEALS